MLLRFSTVSHHSSRYLIASQLPSFFGRVASITTAKPESTDFNQQFKMPFGMPCNLLQTELYPVQYCLENQSFR
jgi:hypothetical protein